MMRKRRLIDWCGQPASPRERRRVRAELSESGLQQRRAGEPDISAPPARRRWLPEHWIMTAVVLAAWASALFVLWSLWS
jgi:hypothetical protein